MSSVRHAAAFALALLLAVGCGGGPSPTDGGTGGDAGPRPDGGPTEPDGGVRDGGARDGGARDGGDWAPDAGTDAGEPSFLPDVVRVAYRFSTSGAPGGAFANVYAALHIVTLTELDIAPERARALYRGRRELGGDCVAYVEEDRSPVSFGAFGGDIFSSAFVGGGDIGPVSASFDDVEGVSLFATTRMYDASAGRYPSYSHDALLEAPLPTLGAVRITTPSSDSNPGVVTVHPVIRLQARIGSVPWSPSGFSVPMEVFDSPGAYLTFGLIGTTAKATVVCAGAATEGRVTLRVPDLRTLLAEVDRDGSFPEAAAYSVGLTDVVDPLLSGPYGLVEQALHGPARLVEWRQPYWLTWE